MCTVTYLPLGNNDFILTSNRDEQPSRKTIPPKEYVEDGVLLTYPKDVLAGGTWIGLSSKDRLVCLLNGGFEPYAREVSYRMSRGVIVKALLKSDDVVRAVSDFDFKGIAPFTIVLIDWNSVLVAYELVWDGKTKHFIELKQEPKIWSSATLYTHKEKLLRKTWFHAWMGNQEQFTQENTLKFHHNTDLGTLENSLKMKRSYVQTVSITSVKKTALKVNMAYYNLN